MDSAQSPRKETRREILKKAAYVAPVVLTLTVSPASVARGSGPSVGTSAKPVRRPRGRSPADHGTLTPVLGPKK